MIDHDATLKKIDKAVARGAQSTPLSDLRLGVFEKALLRRYALSALTCEQHGAISVTEEALRWYDENRKKFGVVLPDFDKKIGRSRRKNGWPGMVRIDITSSDRFAARLVGKLPPPSALQKRLDWIATTLQLNEMQSNYLGAIVRLTEIPIFQALSTAFSGRESDCDEVASELVGRFCAKSRGEARGHRRQTKVLNRLGLIEHRGGDDWAPSTTVQAILSLRTFREKNLREALFGIPRRATLTMADFEHMKDKVESTVSILSGALQQGAQGVAVLFYGAPGTGKTEFATLVGDLLKSQTVFIGEMPKPENQFETGRAPEPSREDRLSHLAFASHLATRSGRTILVVDEADDIFTGVDDEDWGSRTGSKVFMNRLVENSPVPVIFITNNPDRLGEAVLRRMLYAVEFPAINQATRRRVAERHARNYGITLEESKLTELARLPASPALIEAGIKAAGMACEKEGSEQPVAVEKTGSRSRAAKPTAIRQTSRPVDGAVAVKVVASLLKASGHTGAREMLPSSGLFDPALSNADVDLEKLEERVRHAGPGALSFLLDGPPGTGKSAFARYLADALGLEVLQKRGSDIFGAFVGETEANIARAFQEASDTRQFLIFDEVDSLLASRSGAERNWEVSQVNEMLTWMENHPFPFAATSNHAARIDPAASRRFLFKVRFDAMTTTQAETAFIRFFGIKSLESAMKLRLRKVSPLTPADFALVARKAVLLGVTDPWEKLGLLTAEVAAKPGVSATIGF